MDGTLAIGLTQGLIWAGPALCFAIAYRLLMIPDLTVEGSFCIGAAIYAVAMRSGVLGAAAVMLATAGGAAAGALTAIIHRKLKVNAFLSGIIVVAVLYSLTLRLMAGSNIGLLGFTGPVTQVSSRLGSSFGLTLAGAVAVIVAATVFFFRSSYGIRMRAAGANPVLARRMGINSDWVVVVGLGLCNALSAFAGSIMAEQNSFADISLGQGVIITALAAMAIGERLVPRSAVPYYLFVPLSAVLGSLCYAVVSALVLRVGAPPSDIRLATGILVLAAVVIGRRSSQRLSLNGEAEVSGEY
jgi:putative ABC transport system permease protein